MRLRIIGYGPNPVSEPTLAAIEIGYGLGAVATYQLTPAATTVAAATTAKALLAANVSRKAARIMNDPASSGTLNVVELDAGGNPQHQAVLPGSWIEVSEGYLGRVSGWWTSAASGQADIVEYT